MQSKSKIIEVFFDGDCPLCRREINFLRRRDRQSRIKFTDLQKLNFKSPEVGKTHAELMDKMHGRLPDGTWITGVEVFRRMYDAIGWTSVVAVTRWPMIRPILDWMYVQFAARRMMLSGRTKCSDKTCEVSEQ